MLKVYEIIEENNIIFQTAFNLDLSDGGWRLVPGNPRPSKKSADARGRVLRRGVAHSGCTVSPQTSSPPVSQQLNETLLYLKKEILDLRLWYFIVNFRLKYTRSKLYICWILCACLITRKVQSIHLYYRLVDSKFLCTFSDLHLTVSKIQIDYRQWL